MQLDLWSLLIWKISTERCRSNYPKRAFKIQKSQFAHNLTVDFLASTAKRKKYNKLLIYCVLKMWFVVWSIGEFSHGFVCFSTYSEFGYHFRIFTFFTQGVEFKRKFVITFSYMVKCYMSASKKSKLQM